MEKNNSAINNTMNSGNEIKTVYINDIESLNDSSERNESIFNYNPQKNNKLNDNIIKGKYSNSSVDTNLLTNKKENRDIKFNSLNKITKIIKTKEKIGKSNNNTIESTKREKEEKNTKDYQRYKIVSTKNSEQFDKNMIYKLINNKNKKNKHSKNDDKSQKKESGIYFSDNETDFMQNYKNKLSKKKTYCYKNNMTLMKDNEKEMQNQIDYLKKELQLKNNIIQKLIEENKNLIEKIKAKEIELYNSKNKEENLARVIEENNKCISNLNNLILRMIPKKDKNKKIKMNKEFNKSKSGIENENIHNILKRKLSNKHQNDEKTKKISNKDYFLYNNIQLNKEKEEKEKENNVQRYFKLQTRNNIKKNNKLNLNNNRNYLILKNCKTTERSTRNNTMSMDLKKIANNYSDFHNQLIYNQNEKLISNTTKSNINRKKNYNYYKLNMDLIEDNKTECFDKFKRNGSCKNDNIFPNFDYSPKKMESYSNGSANEIFPFSSVANKYRNLASPNLSCRNERKINNSDKNYDFKFIRKLNFSNLENQRILSSKLNYNKLMHIKDDLINNINQSFSIKKAKDNYHQKLMTDDNKKEKYSPGYKDYKKIQFNEKIKKKGINNYNGLIRKTKF